MHQDSNNVTIYSWKFRIENSKTYFNFKKFDGKMRLTSVSKLTFMILCGQT